MKHKLLDLKCYECGHKTNSQDELERGNIVIEGEYTIYFCEKCGNETFVKNKGHKSHALEINK